MRYRALGKTGMEVSEIGFGTWGLGGTAYGPVEDEVSLETLRHAADRGVTFYDTSDLYGDGHAEVLVARAFRGRREDLVIATKGGMLPHSGFVMPQDFTLGHLQRAFAASLERLETDYVDLYQLHSPTLADLEANPAVFEWLEQLKADGRIRASGVSVRSPRDGLAVLEGWDVDVIQVNFNLIDQRALEVGLLDRAAERGIGVIARTPLAFGYLSGKLDGKERLSPGDHRANWPQDQLERWARAPEKFAALNEEPLRGGRERSMVQLALQYCVAPPEVSTVIPGMLTKGQVDENTGAAEMAPLSSDELVLSARIYRENEFFDRGAKSRGASS